MGWRGETSRVMEEAKKAFGETIVYHPLGLSPFSVQAIVDEEFEQIDPNTGAIVSSQQPMIGVKDSDLPKKPELGDTCIVRGVNYRVIEKQQDGQAGTRLILNRQ